MSAPVTRKGLGWAFVVGAVCSFFGAMASANASLAVGATLFFVGAILAMAATLTLVK